MAAGPEFMREVNSSAILAVLRASSPLTVAGVARSTALSRQAVSRALALLEADGLVEFSDPVPSPTGAGRPAQQVRFRAEAGYVVGAHVSLGRVRFGVGTLVGEVVASGEAELPVGASGEDVATALADGVDRRLRDSRLSVEDVWFATVGVPGIVDAAGDRIGLSSSMPELSGAGLHRRLGDALRCPVHLDNDVKLATQGERAHRQSTSRLSASLVYMHWGHRIGAGIVVGGQLLRGVSNDAGDLGFLELRGSQIAPEPARARLGPFESWAGAGEALRLARESGYDRDGSRASSTSPDEALDGLIDAAIDGDRPAVEALREVSRRFAFGVAAVRAIVDPELVVIGGPMARGGYLLLSLLRDGIGVHELNQPALEVSTLGDEAVVQGAVRHSLGAVELPYHRRRRTP
ncbi:ROK family transcriptional regulator [Amnibacterium sp. CER49]|uniref:ROK family transcriptional regulator n=1 Tax=Amnibacterium sp. CER49 TaxID=3039161 RepID=UPI002447B43F|nr:ROK family transcriptional regulator [Amnibacterium sp. CER49]MDH2442586.1 ROK family transcriptional regulator [Amnibacterium sp. CER49]